MPAVSSKWLTNLQSRMRACQQSSGLNGEDTTYLREQLESLDREWLKLSTGREGFLTDERWRGLNQFPVHWGDQVHDTLREDPFSVHLC